MSAKAIDGLRCRGEAGVDSANAKRQVTAVPAELCLLGAILTLKDGCMLDQDEGGVMIDRQCYS